MKTETKTEAYDYAFPAGFPQSGLTKREYFAAMIIQGQIISGKEFPEIGAVQIADRLIEALNASTSTQTLNSKT